MVKCQLCNVKTASLSTENKPNNKLKFKFSFCRDCFAVGTMIVSIWRWAQLDPKYKHPVLKVTKKDSFNDIVKKYLEENSNVLSNWKNR